jgi:hypothetical protein
MPFGLNAVAQLLQRLGGRGRSGALARFGFTNAGAAASAAFFAAIGRLQSSVRALAHKTKERKSVH